MKLDKRFEILLCQYRECLSDIRMRATLIWQIPSMSMAINSFLAITYLGYAKTSGPKLVILFASFFFTFVSTIQLKKHRFFQKARNTDFRKIQTKLRKLLLEGNRMREIELRTEQILDDEAKYPDVSRTWWTQRSAYECFKWSMYATMFVIFVLIVCEAWGFLSSVILLDC